VKEKKTKEEEEEEEDKGLVKFPMWSSSQCVPSRCSQ
jgi:hypothetical protein